MNENARNPADRKRNRIVLALIAVGLLLAAGLFLAVALKNAEAGQRRQREEYAQVFEVYQPYGLMYDAEANRLYYQGKLVRYFEDVIDAERYKKWPSRDGEIDVYARRNSAGALLGVSLFSEQEFADRTAGLKDASCELEIMEAVDGYTSELEEQVKDSIADAYEIYRPFGLVYDREEERLFYQGELVGYFEDSEVKRTFGPYEDSTVEIYAVRDAQGKVTGLDVRRGE